MDKQFVAKIGVFALIGLNVGAYYVFWPSHDNGAKSEARSPREEKGTVQLLPTAPIPAKPKEIAPASLNDAAPLSIPGSVKKPMEQTSPDDAVARLLDHIKKETDAEKKTPAEKLLEIVLPPTMPNPFDEKKIVGSEKAKDQNKEPLLPEAPKFPNDSKPKFLPRLDGDPLKPDNVGVTSPLTSKVPPSPWSLTSEIAGTQKLLIAKLQGNLAPVEFRILCDRVETKSGNTEVVAEGNVTIQGAGLRGACQRLSLPLHETRLVFDGHVAIVHSKAAGMLRGEHIVWELLVLMPVSNPAALGPPK